MPLIFAPAIVSKLITLDPGEMRVVELTLPASLEVEGRSHRIEDRMVPGSAFLCEPFSSKQPGKRLKKLYTRSNTSLRSPRVLQTIINKTTEPDTSAWWQSEDVHEGDVLSVRVEVPTGENIFIPYEHRQKDEAKSLHLESDDWWRGKKFLGIAFATGITPLLAHVRYMVAKNFGKTETEIGAQFVLIVSTKNPRQLMFHEELIDLQARFPLNFWYHAILTREFPEGWPEDRRGRIVRVNPDKTLNMAPLYNIVPDPENYHIRMCGGETARDQLLAGLAQDGKTPQSFRAEAW